jgi:hypothetical protein
MLMEEAHVTRSLNEHIFSLKNNNPSHLSQDAMYLLMRNIYRPNLLRIQRKLTKGVLASITMMYALMNCSPMPIFIT